MYKKTGTRIYISKFPFWQLQEKRKEKEFKGTSEEVILDLYVWKKKKCKRHLYCTSWFNFFPSPVIFSFFVFKSFVLSS
jgi:hypothetical protein